MVGQRRVEFESDGVRDSLTGVLAPASFLEILGNELHVAAREKRAVTVISIRLTAMQPVLTQTSASHRAEIPTDPIKYQSDVALYEELLKSFAHQLSTLIRRGDYCARIAEDGFWVLTRGDICSAQIATKRYLLELDPMDWSLAYHQSNAGQSDTAESMRQLLQRMDALHFTK
jgi:GGDEF domain-containing protein